MGVELIDNSVLCGICQNTLKNPVCLPCGHLFCASQGRFCVKKLMHGRSYTLCTICKKTYHLKPEEFKPSAALAHIVSNSIQQRRAKLDLFFICARHEDCKNEFHCLTCGKDICKVCWQSHSEHKVCLAQLVHQAKFVEKLMSFDPYKKKMSIIEQIKDIISQTKELQKLQDQVKYCMENLKIERQVVNRYPEKLNKLRKKLDTNEYYKYARQVEHLIDEATKKLIVEKQTLNKASMAGKTKAVQIMSKSFRDKEILSVPEQLIKIIRYVLRNFDEEAIKSKHQNESENKTCKKDSLSINSSAEGGPILQDEQNKDSVTQGSHGKRYSDSKLNENNVPKVNSPTHSQSKEEKRRDSYQSSQAFSPLEALPTCESDCDNPVTNIVGPFSRTPGPSNTPPVLLKNRRLRSRKANKSSSSSTVISTSSKSSSKFSKQQKRNSEISVYNPEFLRNSEFHNGLSQTKVTMLSVPQEADIEGGKVSNKGEMTSKPLIVGAYCPQSSTFYQIRSGSIRKVLWRDSMVSNTSSLGKLETIKTVIWDENNVPVNVTIGRSSQGHPNSPEETIIYIGGYKVYKSSQRYPIIWLIHRDTLQPKLYLELKNQLKSKPGEMSTFLIAACKDFLIIYLKNTSRFYLYRNLQFRGKIKAKIPSEIDWMELKNRFLFVGSASEDSMWAFELSPKTLKGTSVKFVSEKPVWGPIKTRGGCFALPNESCDVVACSTEEKNKLLLYNFSEKKQKHYDCFDAGYNLATVSGIQGGILQGRDTNDKLLLLKLD